MLERHAIMSQLAAWYAATPTSGGSSALSQKPLVILGARQVGKTSLVREFAKRNNLDLFECNFEAEPGLSSLFADSLKPEVLISRISLYHKRDFIPQRSLLFFDEVQECGPALTSLKYFCEEAPEIKLAAAGSLLGLSLSRNASFPVGKVHFLQVCPLSFSEFLIARGEEKLLAYLGSHSLDTPMPELFHKTLLAHLSQYFVVGGMPEAVATYVAGDASFTRVREVQHEILAGYLRDFHKHAGKAGSEEVRAVWNSVPQQLAAESSRFFQSKVEKLNIPRQLTSPIQWLIDAGLIVRVQRVGGIELPFSAFADERNFKLYLLDVGLMGSMLKLDPLLMLEPATTLLLSFKGAMAENYIAQELVRLGKAPLYYWASSGKAELDFILEDAKSPIALEVKAGLNPKAKSLTTFLERYPNARGVRCSALNFRKDSRIQNLPLYATDRLASLQ